MKTTGMFWHIHHNVLCEWSDNIKERIEYIKKEKPKNEIKERLRLMQPVKGKLPDEFIEANKARNEAYKAWDKANKAWDKAYTARNEAYKAWDKANKAWDKANKAWDKANKARNEAYTALKEAYKKHKTEIEALHKQECPNCSCSWDGKQIYFKEEVKT